MSIQRKLSALEKMATRSRVGSCTHCRGVPEVVVVHPIAPPGGNTVRFLIPESAKNIEHDNFEDFRCRWCGTEASETTLRQPRRDHG